jgi:CheY-like chemotaxis protein
MSYCLTGQVMDRGKQLSQVDPSPLKPQVDPLLLAGWAVTAHAPGEPGSGNEPSSAGAARAMDEPARDRAALGPVLVVDDETTIREIITETLELEGYSVVKAANGAEALKRIDEQRPSLILLDMRMPILDGWGVARTLRLRGIQVPIVVLTAANNAEAWAREISATDHLAKPFEDTDLLKVVERYCGPARREDHE